MNFQELSNIKPEALAEMVTPLFAGTCQQIAIEYTKAERKDFTKLEWWLITEPTRAFTFDKINYLQTVIDDIDEYMMGQKRLYFFLERPASGLVQSKPRFWVFFSPQVATEYFRRQDQKPANFKKEEIKAYPRFPVAQVLALLLDYIMKFQKGLRNKAKQIPKMLSFARAALNPEEIKAFENQCKRSLAGELYVEVGDLKNINAQGRELEVERVKLVYDILLGFYVQAKSTEQEVIEKLRSKDSSERQKAFVLAEQKLSKYKK